MNDKLKLNFEEYEPKKTDRFIVSFPEDIDLEHWMVKCIDKPKLKIITEDIDVNDIMTHQVKNYQWEDMKMVFLDTINPSASQKFFKLLTEKGNDEWSFIIEIKSLDPTGIVIEKWNIISQILMIDFGELDYGKSNIQEITLLVRPTKCVLIY